MDNINILRKSVRKSKRVDTNTVVRYTKRYDNGGREYNYVAVYIAATDKWYTTGQYENVFDYDDMMTELAKATNVEVVTAWDAL